ncbi:MAG TPA: TetR/AcrR family transcriptional regulator [Rhizobium sp.]|nr:TetR/AcrR family transcriptional regulator [Rhizobium sp.]
MSKLDGDQGGHGTTPDRSAARAPRGERRKRETRAKLMKAAMSLMAERGFEGVAINEITEAADVGFGSFYNHFSSKEEIYASVVDWVFEAFADALEKALDGVSDPAEIISLSIRHTMKHAKEEPLWGRFLVREGLSARSMTGGGLGGRLNRDILRGFESGRFRTNDVFMSFVSVGSTVLGGIVAELDVGDRQQHGLDFGVGVTDALPERTSAFVLKILGLEEEEAARIAAAPLPPFRFDAREISNY